MGLTPARVFRTASLWITGQLRLAARARERLVEARAAETVSEKEANWLRHRLEEGLPAGGAERWLDWFYEPAGTVNEYLPVNTIWIWNDFLLSYLFLPSTDKATLTMQVYNGVGQYFTDWSIMMPVLVLAMLPMVIFYLFMQRHIVGGLTTGSLKG